MFKMEDYYYDLYKKYKNKYKYLITSLLDKPYQNNSDEVIIHNQVRRGYKRRKLQ